MRYVVISEYTSEQETYVDFVQAASKARAVERVSEVRGHATDGHLALTERSVFDVEDLRRLADRLEAMPEKRLAEWFWGFDGKEE